MTSFAPRRVQRTMTARELGRRFGISPRTVQRAIAEDRGAYESRAEKRRVQIIELHRLGMSGREIASALDVTAALVSTRLREARQAGVDLSPMTLPSPVE
jgi:transposase